MIVEGPDGQAVVSTRKFDRIEYLDGGDTIVAHFVCSEHQNVALMIPRDAMLGLISALGDSLNADWNRGRKPDA